MAKTATRGGAPKHAPDFIPAIALILHTARKTSGYGEQNRHAVASLHEVLATTRRRKRPILGPGRLLTRADELRLGHMMITAETDKAHRALLPPGILQIGAGYATWVVQAQQRAMHFRSDTGLVTLPKVPWPTLVLHAQGPSLFVVALASHEHPTIDTSVFHAPLGNIYEDSKVCLGTAAPPRAEPIEAIAEWNRILYDTAFTTPNHEEWIAGRKQSSSPQEFWTELRRQEKFPVRSLKSRDESLGAWLSDIMEQTEDRRDGQH